MKIYLKVSLSVEMSPKKHIKLTLHEVGGSRSAMESPQSLQALYSNPPLMNQIKAKSMKFGVSMVWREPNNH